MEFEGKPNKKWVPAGQNPEGKTYFTEVKVPTLRKNQQPPVPEDPPDDFTDQKDKGAQRPTHMDKWNPNAPLVE